MHPVRFILVPLLAIFLPAVGSATEAVEDSCFPPTIDDLSAVRFPEDRQDAMGGYRNTEVAGYNAPAFDTAVTVFIYDKEPVRELLQEFSASGAEILAAHPGAESPMKGPAALSLAGNKVDGFLGVFLWSEGDADYGSFLWLGESAGRYVKLRATYLRPEQDSETASAMRYAMTAMRRVAEHVCQPVDSKR